MKLMPGSVANILDAVGNTPLVKLNKIGAHTKAEIYAKCEYLNPGGSMKEKLPPAIHARSVVSSAAFHLEYSPSTA